MNIRRLFGFFGCCSSPSVSVDVPQEKPMLQEAPPSGLVEFLKENSSCLVSSIVYLPNGEIACAFEEKGTRGIILFNQKDFSIKAKIEDKSASSPLRLVVSSHGQLLSFAEYSLGDKDGKPQFVFKMKYWQCDQDNLVADKECVVPSADRFLVALDNTLIAQNSKRLLLINIFKQELVENFTWKYPKDFSHDAKLEAIGLTQHGYIIAKESRQGKLPRLRILDLTLQTIIDSHGFMPTEKISKTKFKNYKMTDAVVLSDGRIVTVGVDTFLSCSLLTVVKFDAKVKKFRVLYQKNLKHKAYNKLCKLPQNLVALFHSAQMFGRPDKFTHDFVDIWDPGNKHSVPESIIKRSKSNPDSAVTGLIAVSDYLVIETRDKIDQQHYQFKHVVYHLDEVMEPLLQSRPEKKSQKKVSFAPGLPTLIQVQPRDDQKDEAEEEKESWAPSPR